LNPLIYGTRWFVSVSTGSLTASGRARRLSQGGFTGPDGPRESPGHDPAWAPGAARIAASGAPVGPPTVPEPDYAALRGELLALAREAHHLAGRSHAGDRGEVRDLMRRAGELQREVAGLGLEDLRRWAEGLRRLAERLDTPGTGSPQTPGPG
jgi:hypothetical protein